MLIALDIGQQLIYLVVHGMYSWYLYLELFIRLIFLSGSIFVFWSSQQQHSLIQVPCGGGHRSQSDYI